MNHGTMRLKLYRHLWGYDKPWEAAFPELKAQGYSGVETLLPADDDGTRFLSLLAEHGLEFIVTVHTRGPTVQDHLTSLRRQAEWAKRLGGRFVAAQAGSDAFDVAEVTSFYEAALRIEADTGIAIAHETHRGRPLFHPWATLRILDDFPTLKLVCDFSHWACVCERLLEDGLPVIRRAAEQAFHVHARVGHAQGPQVPDPRVERYRAEVDAHDAWWDLVWDSQRRRGVAESTMCPEFGPPPYLQTNPLTGEPAAVLNDVVDWQRRRQQARFAARAGEAR